MRITQRQGLAFYIATLIGLVCSVAAYFVLIVMGSGVRQALVFRSRTQARYVAEAALVWARERLWAEPTWSAPSGTTLTMNGMNAVITMPECSSTPCEARQLQVKVTF